MKAVGPLRWLYVATMTEASVNLWIFRGLEDFLAFLDGALEQHPETVFKGPSRSSKRANNQRSSNDSSTILATLCQVLLFS